MLALLLACVEAPRSLPTIAPEPPAPALAVSAPPAPPDPPSPPQSYDALRGSLTARRDALAARWAKAPPDARPALLIEARATLLDGVTGQLFPAWDGTPWDFNGTTPKPGAAPVACGYYVSTTLQHAGFKLDRYQLAQQAAAKIAATFAPSEALLWFTDDRPAAIAAVAAAGESLWVVGLDFHVGYLWNDGANIRFCHSNYIDAVGVMCEDARSSDALAASRVHVLARLFDDAMVTRWLERDTVAVHTGPVEPPRRAPDP